MARVKGYGFDDLVAAASGLRRGYSESARLRRNIHRPMNVRIFGESFAAIMLDPQRRENERLLLKANAVALKAQGESDANIIEKIKTGAKKFGDFIKKIWQNFLRFLDQLMRGIIFLKAKAKALDNAITVFVKKNQAGDKGRPLKMKLYAIQADNNAGYTETEVKNKKKGTTRELHGASSAFINGCMKAIAGVESKIDEVTKIVSKGISAEKWSKDDYKTASGNLGGLNENYRSKEKDKKDHKDRIKQLLASALGNDGEKKEETINAGKVITLLLQYQKWLRSAPRIIDNIDKSREKANKAKKDLFKLLDKVFGAAKDTNKESYKKDVDALDKDGDSYKKDKEARGKTRDDDNKQLKEQLQEVRNHVTNCTGDLTAVAGAVKKYYGAIISNCGEMFGKYVTKGRKDANEEWTKDDKDKDITVKALKKRQEKEAKKNK